MNPTNKHYIFNRATPLTDCAADVVEADIADDNSPPFASAF